jgi:hypothetical protein
MKNKIKSGRHFLAVLWLMRQAQREAERFGSKGNKATKRYWEAHVDAFLEAGGEVALVSECRAIGGV